MSSEKKTRSGRSNASNNSLADQHISAVPVASAVAIAPSGAGRVDEPASGAVVAHAHLVDEEQQAFDGVVAVVAAFFDGGAQQLPPLPPSSPLETGDDEDTPAIVGSFC